MTPTPTTTVSPVVQALRSTTLGGKIAAGLLLVLCAVSAKPLYKAVEALLLPTPGEFVASGEDKKAAEAYAAAFDGYVKQLDGRSLWWTPSKPGTDATVVVEEDPQEGDTPPPARYEGPAITAIVFDSVWFADGTKLAVTDDEKDGIKVVSTNAPWEAVIRYRGKEFTVPFFERDRVVFKDAARAAGADARTGATPAGSTTAGNESSTTDTSGPSATGTKE